jgi:hypothetical protein
MNEDEHLGRRRIPNAVVALNYNIRPLTLFLETKPAGFCKGLAREKQPLQLEMSYNWG